MRKWWCYLRCFALLAGYLPAHKRGDGEARQDGRGAGTAPGASAAVILAAAREGLGHSRRLDRRTLGWRETEDSSELHFFFESNFSCSVYLCICVNVTY